MFYVGICLFTGTNKIKFLLGFIGKKHFICKSLKKYSMKQTFFAFLLFFLVGIMGCKSEPAIDEKKVEQIIGDGQDYQDIIRNPISADGLKDTVNVAVASFDEVFHDFGDIAGNAVVNHTFTFTNTGKIPLIIQDATSTCGCTVPKVPKEPFMPNEKGTLEVKFSAEGKTGNQRKPITVFTNGYPAVYTLYISANILE